MESKLSSLKKPSNCTLCHSRFLFFEFNQYIYFEFRILSWRERMIRRGVPKGVPKRVSWKGNKKNKKGNSLFGFFCSPPLEGNVQGNSLGTFRGTFSLKRCPKKAPNCLLVGQGQLVFAFAAILKNVEPYYSIFVVSKGYWYTSYLKPCTKGFVKAIIKIENRNNLLN